MTGSALHSELGASVLVCSGKTLQNDTTTLHQQGVLTNSVIYKTTAVHAGVFV